MRPTWYYWEPRYRCAVGPFAGPDLVAAVGSLVRLEVQREKDRLLALEAEHHEMGLMDEVSLEQSFRRLAAK
jgi:hypothetical protein